MSEDNYVTGVIQKPFEEISWEVHPEQIVYLHGEVEIAYTMNRSSKYEDWSLDEVELNFMELYARDIDGEPVKMDVMDVARGEAYLMGHTKFNDWVDERISNDFDNR